VLDRKTALANIAAGELVHASAPNGASLVCLIEKVTDQIISARQVTSQHLYEFDRTTGLAERDIRGRKVPCIIDSVALLPTDVHDALTGLNRIYADRTRDEDHQLTESERRALVFAARYYPLHPIAPPQSWEMMSVDRKIGEVGDPEDYDNLTDDEKIESILINFLIPDDRS
jgi:hypothetical protein